MLTDPKDRAMNSGEEYNLVLTYHSTTSTDWVRIAVVIVQIDNESESPHWLIMWFVINALKSTWHFLHSMRIFIGRR